MIWLCSVRCVCVSLSSQILRFTLRMCMIVCCVCSVHVCGYAMCKSRTLQCSIIFMTLQNKRVLCCLPFNKIRMPVCVELNKKIAFYTLAHLDCKWADFFSSSLNSFNYHKLWMTHQQQKCITIKYKRDIIILIKSKKYFI